MKGWQVARVVLVIMASFCLLVSCSGSSSDTAAGGGIGGTGYTSSGTITAFGSILVNGVRFDTTKARVIIGGRQKGIGDQAILENLDIGQVVLVEGIANGQSSYGVATRVRFTPLLKGPVASVEDIDQNVKRFKVLGQTVIADDSTIIKNTSIGDLSLDNLIEVSGLMDVAGVVRATYIKKLADSFDPAIEVEIKGIVQNLDLKSTTFNVNDLLVYYGQAYMSNSAEETMASGLWVHVRGKVDPRGFLLATEVEPADETRIKGAEWVDLEGFITDFVSSFDFAVGYIRVQAQGDAKYIAGLSEELEQGTKIRVKGRMVNGILRAQQIIFRERIKLEATVVSKNSSLKTLSLSNLNGVRVMVTNLTRFVGPAKEFDQIQAGDYLRVRGRVWAGKALLATMLNVIPSPPYPEAVVLQGPVENVNNPEIVILGITIDTTSIPENKFEGVGNTDQRGEFFRRVKTGSLVRAWGRIGTTGGITWEGIALEEEN